MCHASSRRDAAVTPDNYRSSVTSQFTSSTWPALHRTYSLWRHFLSTVDQRNKIIADEVLILPETFA